VSEPTICEIQMYLGTATVRLSVPFKAREIARVRKELLVGVGKIYDEEVGKAQDKWLAQEAWPDSHIEVADGDE
jgi:hypothetical protein